MLNLNTFWMRARAQYSLCMTVSTGRWWPPHTAELLMDYNVPKPVISCTNKVDVYTFNTNWECLKKCSILCVGFHRQGFSLSPVESLWSLLHNQLVCPQAWIEAHTDSEAPGLHHKCMRFLFKTLQMCILSIWFHSYKLVCLSINMFWWDYSYMDLNNADL